MSGVVVVGGGLGGLRAAESLRSSGYAGPITVVGDEPHLPYNRPPLSKEALRGGVEVDGLRSDARPASTTSPGCSARRPRRRISPHDRSRSPTGRCSASTDSSIASGIRPRHLPIPGPADGRTMLRTVADAERLRARLAPGAHVLIMGAGFIGCETAATARALGADVTVVALDEEPMIRPLGAELGAAMRRRHEQHGVRFHLGHSVDSFHGDDRVRSATLSDGTELPGRRRHRGGGQRPERRAGWRATAWTSATGSSSTARCRWPPTSRPSSPWETSPGTPTRSSGPSRGASSTGTCPRRPVAGQARPWPRCWPARSPIAGPSPRCPSFWSDQYDHTLQSFGMPGLATRIELADGDLDGPCIVEYHDDRGLVGVVGIDRTRETAPYRAQLMGRSGT